MPARCAVILRVKVNVGHWKNDMTQEMISQFIIMPGATLAGGVILGAIVSKKCFSGANLQAFIFRFCIAACVMMAVFLVILFALPGPKRIVAAFAFQLITLALLLPWYIVASRNAKRKDSDSTEEETM